MQNMGFYFGHDDRRFKPSKGVLQGMGAVLPDPGNVTGNDRQHELLQDPCGG